MADARQVLERHWEAFNAHDAADVFSSDAEMVAPGAGRLEGRQQILAFNRGFWEASRMAGWRSDGSAGATRARQRALHRHAHRRSAYAVE